MGWKKWRRKAKRLVRNPAKRLINKKIRKSSIYRNVARPIIKVGVAGGLGVLTGGTYLAAAVAIGATGAVGGLDNKGFSIKKNILVPAAAGAATGYIASSLSTSSGWASFGGISSETALSGAGLVMKAKEKNSQLKARVAAAKQAKIEAAAAKKLDAEIAQLEATSQPAKQGIKPSSGLLAAGAGLALLQLLT